MERNRIFYIYADTKKRIQDNVIILFINER